MATKCRGVRIKCNFHKKKKQTKNSETPAVRTAALTTTATSAAHTCLTYILLHIWMLLCTLSFDLIDLIEHFSAFQSKASDQISAWARLFDLCWNSVYLSFSIACFLLFFLYSLLLLTHCLSGITSFNQRRG